MPSQWQGEATVQRDKAKPEVLQLDTFLSQFSHLSERFIHFVAKRESFDHGTSWKQAEYLSPPNSAGASWPTWCTSALPSWHSSKDMISRHIDERREMPRSKDKAKIQSQAGRCVYDQRVQIPKSDNCFVWVLYRPWLEQFPAHSNLRRRTAAYC